MKYKTPLITWIPSENSGQNAMAILRFNSLNIAIRFGKARSQLFSERNQGTRGIPIYWRYYFGGRISIRTMKLNRA